MSNSSCSENFFFIIPLLKLHLACEFQYCFDKTAVQKLVCISRIALFSCQFAGVENEEIIIYTLNYLFSKFQVTGQCVTLVALKEMRQYDHRRISFPSKCPQENVEKQTKETPKPKKKPKPKPLAEL